MNALDTLQHGTDHFVAGRIEFLTRANQREGRGELLGWMR